MLIDTSQSPKNDPFDHTHRVHAVVYYAGHPEPIVIQTTCFTGWNATAAVMGALQAQFGWSNKEIGEIELEIRVMSVMRFTE